MANSCPDCNDGDGGCIYPWYGVAPHRHADGPIIDSTRIEPKAKWPANFVEDDEEPGLGTYTHCLSCGRPNRTGGQHG